MPYVDGDAIGTARSTTSSRAGSPQASRSGPRPGRQAASTARASSRHVHDVVGVDRAQRRPAGLEDDLQLALGELRAALLAAVARRLRGCVPRGPCAPTLPLVGRAKQAISRSTFGSRSPAPSSGSTGSALVELDAEDHDGQRERDRHADRGRARAQSEAPRVGREDADEDDVGERRGAPPARPLPQSGRSSVSGSPPRGVAVRDAGRGAPPPATPDDVDAARRTPGARAPARGLRSHHGEQRRRATRRQRLGGVAAAPDARGVHRAQRAAPRRSRHERHDAAARRTARPPRRRRQHEQHGTTARPATIRDVWSSSIAGRSSGDRGSRPAPPPRALSTAAGPRTTRRAPGRPPRRRAWRPPRRAPRRCSGTYERVDRRRELLDHAGRRAATGLRERDVEVVEHGERVLAHHDDDLRLDDRELLDDARDARRVGQRRVADRALHAQRPVDGERVDAAGA